MFDKQWTRQAETKIKELNPDLVLLHIPYDDEIRGVAQPDWINMFVEKQTLEGRAVLYVDQQYTERWEHPLIRQMDHNYDGVTNHSFEMTEKCPDAGAEPNEEGDAGQGSDVVSRNAAARASAVDPGSVCAHTAPDA